MKLPCSIIQEVLPNYVDGCIKEEASQLVKEHLKSCEECRQLYEQMREPMEYDQPHEIDYLKKVKRKNYKKIMLAIVLTLALCIAGIAVKLFVIGSKTSGVSYDNIRIENGVVYATAFLSASAEGISDIHLASADDKGRQHMQVTSALVSFLHPSGSMNFDVPITEITGYLQLGNTVIDSTGRMFDRQAFDLVDQRIPYVGDAPGVMKLLTLMEFYQYGDFKIQLDTAQEPYAIRVIYQNALTPLQSETLQRSANIILACVDNCDRMIIEAQGQPNITVENDKKITEYTAMQDLIDALK